MPSTIVRASLFLAAAALLLGPAPAALAGMQITEFMYNAPDGEFIEFTNTGTTAVNMSGWSFDDDSRNPGTVALGAFGIVQAGESVILAEPSAADFRAAWSLANTVKVIGNNTTNLGRNDEINLFDSTGTLVDRLTYGDQTFPGTIRTNGVSGQTNDPAVLGHNNIAGWVFSAVGDTQGSIVAAGGSVGSPGRFVPTGPAVPEPASWMLSAIGLPIAVTFALRRRRAARA